MTPREQFEAWYCEDAARQGFTMPEGIAGLRDGDHYGKHRAMLNGKWEGWQAAMAATPVLHAPRHGLELHASPHDLFFNTFTLLVDPDVPEGEAHLIHEGRVLAKLVLS